MLNRRIFLRGLGGACVAAPFLSSLSARGVKAQAVTAPKRLILLYTHYGCVTTRFFPKRSHGALAAQDLQGSSLEPLVPFVDKLLMPRGIRAMNEWTSTLSRGQGNDAHLQAAASYFTCQPVSPNSDDPFSFAAATKFNATPLGPSLDHVMAQQLSTGGTPFLMRVGNQTETPTTAISYSAANMPFPGFGLPGQAFSALTGLFNGGPTSSDTYQAVRGRSILDLVKDDLATLERFDMSQADKHKLEAWKQLLDETGHTVSAQCDQGLADSLGETQANFDAFGQEDPASDVLTTKLTSSVDGADLYSLVAVLAAYCHANPVIVLKYPAEYTFTGLGLTHDSLLLSMRIGSAYQDARCLPGVLDMLEKIDTYYAQKLAFLVGQLNSSSDGDGTLLDNTGVVWFQQMSDGNAQNLNNLPIVQLGSMGGYFKTGWAVNVDDGAADLTQGNSEAFCNDPTQPVEGGPETSGTDAKFANAPINKYFCTLMNALGVRAGADGFPAVGGTAEVTKYGMYDKTEDFVHGGTNPPAIHDPGEFTALKAET